MRPHMNLRGITKKKEKKRKVRIKVYGVAINAGHIVVSATMPPVELVYIFFIFHIYATRSIASSMNFLKCSQLTESSLEVQNNNIRIKKKKTLSRRSHRL